MSPTRRQPVAKQQPTHRAYTPFDDTEIELIDGWGFERRIRDRSAAIRELVLRALRVDQAQQHSEAPPA